MEGEGSSPGGSPPTSGADDERLALRRQSAERHQPRLDVHVQEVHVHRLLPDAAALDVEHHRLVRVEGLAAAPEVLVPGERTGDLQDRADVVVVREDAADLGLAGVYLAMGADNAILMVLNVWRWRQGTWATRRLDTGLPGIVSTR